MGSERRTSWWIVGLAVGAVGLCIVAAILVTGPGSGRLGPDAHGSEGPAARAPAPVLVAPEAETPLDSAVARESVTGPGGAPASEDAPPEKAVELEPGLPFRGQVVDVATREPVPRALVKVGGVSAQTDEDGRFAKPGTRTPEGENVEVYDPEAGTHIRTIQHEAIEIQRDLSWVAPIAIGPTFRLTISGAGEVVASEWRARVIETTDGLPDQVWGWARLRAGEPLWFRYDNPQKATHPGGTLWLEVANAAGTLRGRARTLYSIVGVHPQVVSVVTTEHLARVAGRVVDSLGRPLNKAQVLVLPDAPLAGNAWLRMGTDGEGRFVVSSLPPGYARIHVTPRGGQEPQSRRVLVPAGESELDDFIFDAVEPAGSIEGVVKSRGEKELPPVVVRLRATDGRSYERYERLHPAARGRGYFPIMLAGGTEATFGFGGVPTGQYELEVLATDGSRFTPERLDVSPPAKGVVIYREDEGASWEAVFDVRDAATDEALDSFELQLLHGGLFFPDSRRHDTGEPVGTFPDGTRFRWNVRAEGYRLTSGDERAFEGAGSVRVATVRLERGFAARLHLRDCQGDLSVLEGDEWSGTVRGMQAPPVAGVRVLADGVPAATSDARGLAELELEEAPGTLELSAPGWRMLGGPDFKDGRFSGDTLEVVVWMLRE